MDKIKDRYVELTLKDVKTNLYWTFITSFIFVTGSNMLSRYFIGSPNYGFEIYLFYLLSIWITMFLMGLGINLLMKMSMED